MAISGKQKRWVPFALAGFSLCAAMLPLPAKAVENGTGAGAEAAVRGASDPQGERKAADEINALRIEMKERPTDAAACRLGELLLGKGDMKEALAAFDAALALNPRSFEARIGKGVVLGRQGEFAQAEQLLRDALVLNPNPVRVHYELGRLFEHQGDFGKAVFEYKEGLKKYQEGKK